MESLSLAVSLVAGLVSLPQLRDLDAELGRFPTFDRVFFHYTPAVERHREWLLAQQPRDDLAIASIDRCLKAYELLILARSKKTFVRHDRLQFANQLRDIIGDKAYRDGKLPLPLADMEKPDR
jgi:hypothetical protein